MSNVRRWQGAHWERNLTGGQITAETLGQGGLACQSREADSTLVCYCFHYSKMSSFSSLVLAARFQSSGRGEVPAPTSCCLISALEKVSSNSLKKPVEHLKVRREGPLSFPNNLIADYHSSLASRPSAVPKQGQAQLHFACFRARNSPQAKAWSTPIHLLFTEVL